MRGKWRILKSVHNMFEKKYEFFFFNFILGINLFYILKNSLLYVENVKIILLLANICGILSIYIRKKVNSRMMIIYLGILVITIFYFGLYRNYSFLTIFVCLIACEEIDADKLIKYFLYSGLVLFIPLQILGVGSSKNTLGLQISILILMYISTKKCNLTLLQYICLGIVLISATVISTSKALFVITTTALFLTIIKQTQAGKKFLRSKFSIYIFPICFFANFFLAERTVDSNGPLIGTLIPRGINAIIVNLSKLLDKAMSWRLSLTKQALNYFGFSMIGGNIDMDSIQLDEHSYFYIDSGYTYMLLAWGVIFSIMFLVLMTIIMHYFVQIQRYDLIIAGICIALWGANEPILNLVNWNFIILFGGQAIKYLIIEKRLKANFKRRSMDANT